MLTRVKVVMDRKTGKKISEEITQIDGNDQELLYRAAEILMKPVIQGLLDSKNNAISSTKLQSI